MENKYNVEWNYDLLAEKAMETFPGLNKGKAVQALIDLFHELANSSSIKRNIFCMEYPEIKLNQKSPEKAKEFGDMLGVCVQGAFADTMAPFKPKWEHEAERIAYLAQVAMKCKHSNQPPPIGCVTEINELLSWKVNANQGENPERSVAPDAQ